MRAAVRAVLRFGASVAAVAGTLMLADAAATLLWQEPLSALLASRDQAVLRAELALPPATSRTIEPARLAELARRAGRRRRVGEPIGRIELPTLGRTRTVVEGTRTTDLRRGPGHFPSTAMPGAGQTAGIAGHRTTYGAPFKTVDRLRRGNPIVLETPYARLVYRVERIRIVPPTALWVVKPVGYDRLVLTACHPLYSAAQRIVVFARLESAFAVSGVRRRSPEANGSAEATPSARQARPPGSARPLKYSREISEQ